jgi:succinate-acetate transporter protein
MLMFITTGWGEDATIAAVISYAMFYGGFGQMVAGVFEVRTSSAAGDGEREELCMRRPAAC